MTNRKKYSAIAMGASIGGLDALSEVLKCLPGNYPLPIFVVLHRLKGSESALSEILGRKVRVIVKEAEDKEEILPGHVYVAPADYHMLIEFDQKISLDFSERVNFSRPSIDVTFESAAMVYQDQLIGVLMTGANNDGSAGLNKIASKKGLTIVQDPDEAFGKVMPQAAIKTVKVDHIKTLRDICRFITEIPNDES